MLDKQMGRYHAVMAEHIDHLLEEDEYIDWEDMEETSVYTYIRRLDENIAKSLAVCDHDICFAGMGDEIDGIIYDQEDCVIDIIMIEQTDDSDSTLPILYSFAEAYIPNILSMLTELGYEVSYQESSFSDISSKIHYFTINLLSCLSYTDTLYALTLLRVLYEGNTLSRAIQFQKNFAQEISLFQALNYESNFDPNLGHS